MVKFHSIFMCLQAQIESEVQRLKLDNEYHVTKRGCVRMFFLEVTAKTPLLHSHDHT